MKKIKLYEGAAAAEGADIALKAHLYVSGWQLSHELDDIRSNAKLNPKTFSVAIAFDDEIPVAVVIRRDTMLQAFCRAAERRRGFASACARKIRDRHPELQTSMYAYTGIDGSYNFWKFCLIDRIDI